MSNNKNLRRFVVFDEDKPSDFEMMLEAIEFMQAELGIYTPEVPGSYEKAKQKYADLRIRVLPPTDEQLRELQRLLEQTGGALSGELCSNIQVSLLIEALQDKCKELPQTEQGKWKKWCEAENLGERQYQLQERWITAIIWAVGIALMVIMLVSSFHWSNVMLGVFFLNLLDYFRDWWRHLGAETLAMRWRDSLALKLYPVLM